MAEWDIYNWWQAALGASEQDISGGYNVGGLFDPTFCLEGPGAGAAGEYKLTIAWRGQTTLPDSKPANTCGDGLYDSPSQDNGYRRLLVMTTYMHD
jgi:type IV pilus assembly protein PilV